MCVFVPSNSPNQSSSSFKLLSSSELPKLVKMLGENLYPFVEQLEIDNGDKVMGMFLEMDQTEILHLLESPDALKAKLDEAMEVLRDVAEQHTSSRFKNPSRLKGMLCRMASNIDVVKV
ncbi:hypothetical protein FNV43_RR05547 [Rhamnella rubrinervis]|uniref:PABC domain-containing protein n=1 Tax=Rhamnella rubrinervis TaxID=2594499 RepID=A0A8K0HP83_9ROSA|nr:hypothetical protein FNV43_RR05547 [Rhamnella rubrinervis]